MVGKVRTMGYEVRVEQMGERVVYGVGAASNDRTLAHDIDRLAKAHAEAAGAPAGGSVPLFVVSHAYDPSAGDCELFVGGEAEADGLERFAIPAGAYARIELAPALRALWGASVGKAKRWLYTTWLPTSGYVALNLEYEHHTEKTLGRRPRVDLLFAIEKTQAEGTCR